MGTVALKEKNPNLKVLVSVGGWTAGGWIFSQMAETHEGRAKFIKSVVHFIKYFGFDGMDLDWEYPALDMWPVVPTNPEDKQHFTSLMKEIRHAFDIEGFLLTFAAAPDPAKANNAYELEEVHKYVDWMNIMFYDYSGPWDNFTGIDAPLYFKEVIIMSSSCDICAHRSNTVKAGGAIEEYGKKITLKMTDPSDLIRDVLKSESCAVKIPELNIEMNFTSEGKFTTLEGLLVDIKEDMGRINPFGFGDSAEQDKRERLEQLKNDLDQVISGERMVTIIFDDPVGNSYIQNTYAPEDDPELTIEKYERTDEQNEEFGIADMNTENYREDEEES